MTVIRLLSIAPVVLLVGSLSGSVSAASPKPLDGTPLILECEASVGLGHALLDRHSGRDLYDILPSADGDPATALSTVLCGEIWNLVERAGAHSPSRVIDLPAVAKLKVQLVEASLTSERISQEFFGREVSFVPVPHWALEMSWAVDFSIVSADGFVSSGVSGPTWGKADQGDYSRLDLEQLVEQSIGKAFSRLPELIVDEGGLGNLFFQRVERPTTGPQELQAPKRLDQAFWLLLTPDLQTRHAAMAVLLASEEIPLEGRRQLATWFLINDPETSLRSDALAWLIDPQAEEETTLSTESGRFVEFILKHDRSPTMRLETTEMLSRIGGSEARTLLLIASMDSDIRVADRASAVLRRRTPSGADEIDMILARKGRQPVLAPWTASLDGRVASSPESERELVQLAENSDTKPGARWLSLWLKERPLPTPNEGWVFSAWTRLSAHSSNQVRSAALDRFSRALEFEPVQEAIVDRIRLESSPELQTRAIQLATSSANVGLLNALLGAASTTAPEVRRAVAEALALFADAESHKCLEQLRDDSDRKVRRQAKKSLRIRKRSAKVREKKTR